MSDKVSVIVPIYNGEKYLDRCIKSILNQSYDNIELILVDDGSQDSSGSICDKYAHDDRIKVLHITNSGAANARQKGVEASTGEYISFVDCDDWISEDMIEYLYKLIKTGDYEMSACDNQVIYSEEEIENSTEEKLTQLDYSQLTKGLYDYSLWSMCAKLYKRCLFSKLDGVDIHLSVSEDLLTNYYLTKNTDAIIVSNLKKYYYFRHKDSVMAKPLGIDRVNSQLIAYKTIYNDFDSSSDAFCYQAANRLRNDFQLINHIIKYKSDKELYELVRADFCECSQYVFDKRNSYCFGFKHRFAARLLIKCPLLYNIMIKILK